MIFCLRNRNVNNLQKNAPHQILKPTMKYKLNNSFHYNSFFFINIAIKHTNMHYTHTHLYSVRENVYENINTSVFLVFFMCSNMEAAAIIVKTYTQKHMK